MSETPENAVLAVAAPMHPFTVVMMIFYMHEPEEGEPEPAYFSTFAFIDACTPDDAEEEAHALAEKMLNDDKVDWSGIITAAIIDGHHNPVKLMGPVTTEGKDISGEYDEPEFVAVDEDNNPVEPEADPTAPGEKGIFDLPDE